MPQYDAAKILFRLLNEECGIDFSHYKPNTVNRRVQRRLSIVGARSLNEYVERLRSDRDELNSLYKDLLIGVTRFFRDQEAFTKLEEVVIPEMIRQTADEEEIRVWVAACATGEEAYSIAMLIHEQLEAAGRAPNVKVFATDVHRASLDIAAAGVYGREALSDVTPERLARYFDQRPDGYHVVPELRQIVVFAKHNLIHDAPFTKLNLITCRNLLIYFDPAAQKRSLSLFHFGLKTGGILFLGTSETPGDLQDEFDAIDAHWKIYRKCRDVRLADVRLPALGGMVNLVSTRPAASMPTTSVRGLPDIGLVGAYDAMLGKFMPPGLLINERRELLHTFGGAERHLSVKPGRPSNDVLDMLGHELRTAVTGAVQRALKEDVPVSYLAVRITTEQGEQQLRVGVEPLINPRSRLKQLLIVLEPLAPTPAHVSMAAAAGDVNMQQMSRDRIEALETELRYTKENLQATIEELETSNEELQAANEELVTSNEELQSTNEELQSVNEELYTVNAEYQKKISELSELTTDMDNLLASTDVGTIFLDQDLCIRKFTPQIASQFHFLPQDIGRPINSFAHNIVHPGLIDDMRHVAATNERCEHEVRDRQGNWQYLRIMPYRMKKKVDGVVLTLFDITPIKKAQAALGEAIRRRDEFLAMLSHELRNPLGAILHAANILSRRESEDDTLRQIGEVLCRQGQQMARLLDDLLDVSRITQDKMEMRKEPTPLSAIVEGAVESVRPQIEGCNLNFSIENNHPSLHVNGDPVRLQQAIANLLVNAAKYTPPRGTVSLEVVPDGTEAVLCVSDNGAGIAQEDIGNIFDLFVQCDQTLSRSKGGMGVGLTLVRSIVEQHNGSVMAHSDGPGHGSRFEIRLPLLKNRPKRLAAERTDRAPPHGDCTIVVVEDQDDNRHMLRALLQLDGYRVFTAENGPKGLAAIEQHRPDIALIDIGLPGLTGYEVATQVRESLGNKQTYLVALTGYGQPQDVQAAFDAGFDNHIVKPFDAKKLTQMLDAHRRQPCVESPPRQSAADGLIGGTDGSKKE